MAAETGTARARAGGIVAVLLALVALCAAGAADVPQDLEPEPLLGATDAPPSVDPEALRVLAARVSRSGGADGPTAVVTAADGAAPLPGPEWNDPDTVNWADAPQVDRDVTRERIADRRMDRGPLPGSRLLERLRSELRVAVTAERTVADPATLAATPADATAWPEPKIGRAHV